MGEDRSLDEFFDARDDDERNDLGSDDEGDRDDERNDADANDPDAEATDEEPAVTEEAVADTETPTAAATDLPRATYRWSPDGDDCPACGTRVEQQWRDGDQFVCADCKEW